MPEFGRAKAHRKRSPCDSFSVSGCRRFAIEPVSGAAEGLVSKAPTNFFATSAFPK
jgi:hypothetical protein